MHPEPIYNAVSAHLYLHPAVQSGGTLLHALGLVPNQMGVDDDGVVHTFSTAWFNGARLIALQKHPMLEDLQRVCVILMPHLPCVL